jgi:cation-transporting ATPase 13A3/4/5
LQWESIDNNIYLLDKTSLTVSPNIDHCPAGWALGLIIAQPLPAPPEGDISLPYDISSMQNYSLAVSGEAFRWIIDYAPADIVSKVCFYLVLLRNMRLTSFPDARKRKSLCSNVAR